MEKIFKIIFLSIQITSLSAILSSAQVKERPNFVFIIADDISWNDFGCYGNKVVKTPNIDQLASEGLRFTSAFLTASSCSPSRCSIISGKYPHSNGAAELHTSLPESEIPFPLLLRENGYYTAQAGKFHMGSSAHRAFDRFTDGPLSENGDGGEDNWVKFLQERPKDKLFFFWLASFDAHRPWGADDFYITHDPDDVEIPVYFADTPETQKDMASYYNEIGRFDYFIGKVREELENQGVVENTIMIVMADNGRPFPRCKTRVYDSGMQTPFIVWGKALKQKGTVANGLISSIDIAPTILELAGVNIPISYQGISFIPILKNPTVETRNEIFAEHNWHDYEAHERMVRTKDYLYLLNSRPELSNCGPADSKTSSTQAALNELRDEGKLSQAQADVFVTPRPAEELYQVKVDPQQLLNLASVPAYQKKLDDMRTLLKNWQQNTGDTTPDDLTPDYFDRETGKPLPKELNPSPKRGTMPGIQSVHYN